MRCADCGTVQDGDLCAECAEVAAALGWSKPERLQMLGVLQFDT